MIRWCLMVLIGFNVVGAKAATPNPARENKFLAAYLNSYASIGELLESFEADGFASANDVRQIKDVLAQKKIRLTARPSRAREYKG